MGHGYSLTARIGAGNRAWPGRGRAVSQAPVGLCHCVSCTEVGDVDAFVESSHVVVSDSSRAATVSDRTRSNLSSICPCLSWSRSAQ